ncbi:MAG: hypothetical protein ABI852_05170, partial [Gemmatimonadaceae bacterium]
RKKKTDVRFGSDQTTTYPMHNSLSAHDWWAAQRRRYIITLLVGGALGFIVYATVVSSSVCASDVDAEITIFTTFFQGIGFLFAVGVADVCYSLGGKIVQKFVPAGRVHIALRYAYWAGVTFSLALIATVPILAYVSCSNSG